MQRAESIQPARVPKTRSTKISIVLQFALSAQRKVHDSARAIPTAALAVQKCKTAIAPILSHEAHPF